MNVEPITFPFEAPVIRVIQPLGIFYVTVLPAELVLQVSQTDRLRAERNPRGGYFLKGTQREMQDKRLSQIAGFLNRVDASFPNAIIIAANYNFDFDVDQEEVDDLNAQQCGVDEATEETLWFVKDSDIGSGLTLVIPTARRLAAIIDGQHRLFAFTKANVSRLDMSLICSIFIDLPKSYQAQLFATINSTQKPVDRSLTYELFGYNIGEETETYWTPDKLAVYFTRRLGTLEGSPLFGRIRVAPKRDLELQRIQDGDDWKISTAVVVDGILRLISSNPKRDSNLMSSPGRQPRKVLNEVKNDRSPLRDEFVKLNDLLIYQVVINYLQACDAVFWGPSTPGSYICKTTGVQALFDILRKIIGKALLDKDVTVAQFTEALKPAAEIDFSARDFQIAAGAGRSLIRKTIERALGIP